MAMKAKKLPVKHLIGIRENNARITTARSQSEGVKRFALTDTDQYHADNRYDPVDAVLRCLQRIKKVSHMQSLAYLGYRRIVLDTIHTHP